MLIDVSQDSCTLTQNATGHGNTLGLFHEPAGQLAHTSPAPTQHTAAKQPLSVSLRHRVRPRIAAELVTAALGVTDALPAQGTTNEQGQDAADVAAADAITATVVEAASATAGRLHRIANAARMARRARHQRGEIAAWRTVMLDLPDDFVDARDELEHFATRIADDINEARSAIEPVIQHLTGAQRSPTSFEITPLAPQRGHAWAGIQHWQQVAERIIDHARATGTTVDCSPHNVRALLRALSGFLDANGKGCTASTATIVAAAIDRHGATCSPATGARRLRTITSILEDAGLLVRQAKGRHLNSIERMAAHIHHGHHQTRAANRWDAAMPAHMMPAPSPTPSGPSWATGLTARLAARDAAETTRIAVSPGTAVTCDSCEPSTYPCWYGCLSSSCGHWGAHERAQARANTENNSQRKKETTDRARRTPISLRARRIADDLTRTRTGLWLDSGPYSHLCGPESHQMTLTHLARLIDAHTPSWAGTRDVLGALAHTATSPATGHIALGLHTRPDNAAAWITSVLSSIDWSEVDAFPAWSTVAEAFGLHWCGNRRHWENVG